MTDQDWATWYVRAMMVFLNGEAIAESDERGQRIVGDSFLALINASDKDITFTLPGEGYAPAWKVALDTAPAADGDSGPVLAADDTVIVEARSIFFLIDAPESAATTERHPRWGLSAAFRCTTERTSPIRQHHPTQTR